MKYFLTGATGFVGGRLGPSLREKDHDVIALVRNPSKAADLVSAGVTVVPGDVTEFHTPCARPWKAATAFFTWPVGTK